MSTLFAIHKLNTEGIDKARAIAQAFDDLHAKLKFALCADPETRASAIGREFAIVATKLEEACFFAKKAMAVHPKNQET